MKTTHAIVLGAALALAAGLAQAQNPVTVIPKVYVPAGATQVFGVTADRDIPPASAGRPYVVTWEVVADSVHVPYGLIRINGVQVLPGTDRRPARLLDEPRDPLSDGAGALQAELRAQGKSTREVLEALRDYFLAAPGIADARVEFPVVAYTRIPGAEEMDHKLALMASSATDDPAVSTAVRAERLQRELDRGWCYIFLPDSGYQYFVPRQWEDLRRELARARSLPPDAGVDTTAWGVLRPKTVAAILAARKD